MVFSHSAVSAKNKNSFVSIFNLYLFKFDQTIY